MDPQTAQQPQMPSANPATQTAPTPLAPAQQPTGQPVSGPLATSQPKGAKKSSNMMWIIMIIIIVAILAVAGWFLYQNYMIRPVSEMTPAPTTMPSPTLGPVKSGDTQLDQQSDEIDGNMMKVETDIKGVDAGLNDKSVNLTQ